MRISKRPFVSGLAIGIFGFVLYRRAHAFFATDPHINDDMLEVFY